VYQSRFGIKNTKKNLATLVSLISVERVGATIALKGVLSVPWIHSSNEFTEKAAKNTSRQIKPML
jgi:hypothetical protein